MKPIQIKIIGVTRKSPQKLCVEFLDTERWSEFQGYAIEWIDLDEHIGVEGLLAGRQSGESHHSFERWLATRGTSSRLDRTNNSNAADS